MRALRYDHYGSPDVLRVVEVPEPIPRTGEVKVRVRAAGLNPLTGKPAPGICVGFPAFADRPAGSVAISQERSSASAEAQ